MKTSGILFIFSSPSGAGKTSLCRELVGTLSDLHGSVSSTTRQPRSGERDGVDYHFLSDKKFQEMVEKGKFAEWAQVYGYKYGSLIDEVKRYRNQGIDQIFTIDVQGAAQLKKKYPEAVSIFILPPSLEILQLRMKQRGSEDPEEMRRRFEIARKEIAQKDKYDYIVVNDDFKEALEKLKSIIIAERCRTKKILPEVEELFDGN
ncbi:MAG: guanylate kinase [Deltaproteobacteria bacterium]|nr:MAG: guanylate kinase [Deltaproteobacteria bacterium]